MLSIPDDTIQFILAPLLTAQLVLVVLCYFALFSRHVLQGFTLHIAFLLSFFVFLLGKALQAYTDTETETYILAIRLILFLGIGLPALLILLYQQCGIKLKMSSKVVIFIFSFLLACSATFLQDITKFYGVFTKLFIDTLPTGMSPDSANYILTFQFVAMLLLPCLFLLWREFSTKSDPMSVAFLLGGLQIAIAHLLSHSVFETYWIIYIGAIFTTLCWAWAVYYDVKRTRGKAYAVKDELLGLLHSGRYNNEGKELTSLLRNLAQSADGDIQLYKLQVREVLTRLAELSINEGANSDNMLAAAKKSYLAIDKITNVEEIVAITEQETRTLGHQHHVAVVNKAKQFITDNFSQELDLKSVANHCGVSQSYLMRYFKQESQQTINQFITSTRIEIAKKLLESKNITDVAFTVGFNNSNYFSTVFKKITGQTPGQFKQNLENNHSR